MLVYNYHPTYKHYVGEEEAPPSPEEPGEWLIPAHSTTEKPPNTKKGELAVWKETRWEIKELIPRGVEKVCPLLRQPCIKDLCEWFIPLTPIKVPENGGGEGKCSILLLTALSSSPPQSN